MKRAIKKPISKRVTVPLQKSTHDRLVRQAKSNLRATGAEAATIIESALSAISHVAV